MNFMALTLIFALLAFIARVADVMLGYESEKRTRLSSALHWIGRSFAAVAFICLFIAIWQGI